MNIQIEKTENFDNEIIFVDGLWGTGKSLLGPIVSSMENVEWYRSDPIFEYICWFNKMKKISDDAAIWLLKTRCDNILYDTEIGREINLRWSDDTGLKNIPNKFSRISKLWKADGKEALENIKNNNSALCIMPHMLALAPDLLFDAFDKRIKFIEVVRHPLHLIPHVKAYLDRYESIREFTPSFYTNGVKIPWILNDRSAQYQSSNSMERAVIFICVAYQKLRNEMQNLNNLKIANLIISFENIVFNTKDTLEILENFLNRKQSSKINKILKKQLLPREFSFAGKGHKSYGWKKQSINENTYHKNLQTELINNCCYELLTELLEVVEWYNNAYPSKLSKYEFDIN